MNEEKKLFETSIEEVLNKCKNLLLKKGKEYSNGQGKFHNFIIASKLLCCTPETALASMMAKHTVSIYDMCNATETGHTFSIEQWDEKICDHINYLLLLRTMVVMNNKY